MTPLLVLGLLAAPGYAECPAPAPPTMLLQGRSCRSGCNAGQEVYIPQAGDIILFRNPSFFARAAYYVTFSGGLTHVALVVARPDGRLCLLEATPKYGVIMGDLPTRVTQFTGQLSVRRRITPLTPEQSASMSAFACAQVGKKFYYLAALAPPVSFPFRIFCKPVDMQHLERSRWICTTLALRTCIAAGLIGTERINPEGTCPSDIATDYLLDLSEGWYPPIRFVEPCE